MDEAPTLLEALQRPDAWPHDVPAIELRETHISWILLAGEYAYKIKKPVNFGFLDFSTLERRRHFCEQELRLNGRFAPDIYLDVVAITGTADAPRIGGDGPAIEYAVRMRRFDDENLFSRLIADGRLLNSHVDALAAEVGRFHASADVAPASTNFGSPSENERITLDNIRVLQSSPGEMSDRVAELERWTRTQVRQLKEVFEQRRAAGFVRECHGDLHLGNIVLIDDRVTLFDGIEFNESLRWIDVLSDAAFVVMDLADRGRPDLSWRFLNAYLEVTGDYAGVRLLPWYLVYRSLVRAKVACLRSQQDDVTPDEREHRLRQVNDYTQLALDYTRRKSPTLYITHGVSGSGKTSGTTRLMETIGAIRIRSDVERTRIARVASDAASAADPSEKYSAEQTRDTYRQLKSLARSVLEAGFLAIVDATFLLRRQRGEFQALADELHVQFRILPFTADELALKSRITQRQSEGRDASEATIAVLEKQLATLEPLDQTELAASTSPDAIIAEHPSPKR